jgi:predicted HTH domain antitoxin
MVVVNLATKPLGVRVSEEMEQQLAEFMREEGVDKSTAVRKILERGISGWRVERALKLLGGGKITFARAAKLAGVSLWELAELVRERRIEWVYLTPQEIEREFKLARRMAR